MGLCLFVVLFVSYFVNFLGLDAIAGVYVLLARCVFVICLFVGDLRFSFIVVCLIGLCSLLYFYCWFELWFAFVCLFLFLWLTDVYVYFCYDLVLHNLSWLF